MPLKVVHLKVLTFSANQHFRRSSRRGVSLITKTTGNDVKLHSLLNKDGAQSLLGHSCSQPTLHILRRTQLSVTDASHPGERGCLVHNQGNRKGSLWETITGVREEASGSSILVGILGGHCLLPALSQLQSLPSKDSGLAVSSKNSDHER